MVSSFDFPLRLRATGWPIGLRPNSIPRIFRDNLYPPPSRRRTNDVDFQVSLRWHATVFSGGREGRGDSSHAWNILPFCDFDDAFLCRERTRRARLISRILETFVKFE